MSTRASVFSRASTVRQTEPFSAQPPETQLNQSAFLALDSLKKSEAASANGGLQKTLARAAELIQNIATTINDRAAEERTRRQTRLARLKRDGEDESDEAREQHEHFQKQVEDLTKKMDAGIRRVVDNQHWAKELPSLINHVIDQSKDLQTRSRRRQQDADSEENEDEDDWTQPPAQSLSALLHAAQTTNETEWTGKSLAERYSQNETYKTYYELIWHAKNPGEHPPPLPHHSLWFAAQEGRNPLSSQLPRSAQTGTQRGTQRSTQNQDEFGAEINEDINMLDARDEEDTELQISSHVRSTKCPLTLRYFVEPVTSTKCPHSFEKTAVMGFIRQSAEHTPLTPDQIADLDNRYPRGSRGRQPAETSARARNPKHVRCPEGGCKVWLTENDLRPDPVLARMVKRAKDVEKRAQEEEQGSEDDLAGDIDDDGLPTGAQRKRKTVVPIDSSPTGVSGGVRRRTLIKGEREISVVPNSQVQGTPSRSQISGSRARDEVMDVDDEDDEDDE
ncbi:hypothetical protein H2198_007907 [Neophaeococcomyces mojaviensis]|uniref:Uncharacterized protein n=1 Tax=Neophaeococcomyces mojaviensis TaxID=3383035 RepID=A0ACC2ZYT0_9EURO|nr:hypothetical protein H2198_007907 [Knufia sp. JES_112]